MSYRQETQLHDTHQGHQLENTCFWIYRAIDGDQSLVWKNAACRCMSVCPLDATTTLHHCNQAPSGTSQCSHWNLTLQHNLHDMHGAAHNKFKPILAAKCSLSSWELHCAKASLLIFSKCLNIVREQLWGSSGSDKFGGCIFWLWYELFLNSPCLQKCICQTPSVLFFVHL